MSVCRVVETTLYYRGLPASGGLLDPLMGTVDRRHVCATCMNDPLICQGHPGHIDLAYPVYHISFLDTVLKVLRTVCFSCARVCVSDEERSVVEPLVGRHRLAALYNFVRTRRTCTHCQRVRPTYTRHSYGIGVEWPSDVAWESDDERQFCTQPFTAREALSICRNIPDDDVQLLGFHPERSHPMNMILEAMVVCPPCARPAVYSSEGSRSRGQNDLTMRYLEIMKRSNELANEMHGVHFGDMGPVSGAFIERLNRLQYEVFMIINNSVRIQKPAGMGRNSSNIVGKSLHERLKGKEGRVRGNLMGKRVDFSARCVITPDANFEVDRVGVPYRIAKSLTIPMTVNIHNVSDLTRRVRNGANSIHGAQNVIHVDGTITNLAACKNVENISLQPGDVVERYLADDDVVVFNRQPSLHMHSTQAHRVRLMPGHTFRISLVVAAPYNADFDGDEMNLHVPQGRAATAETAALMGIAQNCIGSQANRPVMGIVQDSLVGMYLLSQRQVLLEHPHVCRMLGTLRHTTVTTLPEPAVSLMDATGNRVARLWTGKQMIAHVMPKGLYVEPHADLSTISDLCNDEGAPVVVWNGIFLTGQLTKAHVGSGTGGIVDVLAREFDGVTCLRFMGDTQRLTQEFLLQRGHHVGIHDVMLSNEGQTRVNDRLAKATLLCEEIQREIIDAPPTTRAMGESAILRLLSKTLLQSGSIVNEYMSPENAIRRMVTAKSKGTFINLSQICAALGQQSLEGSRIVAEKGSRTLPCFAHNDISLAGRGMVYNSFSLGLTSSELFFHAIGGREGLVDTAVKTSQSGYIQRRMNKSMEECRVLCDGTIRNSDDDVISFVWGSDGFHPTRIERVKLDFLTMTATQRAARLDTEDERRVMEDAVAQILIVKRHLLAGAMDARVLLPFNPVRILRFLKRVSQSGSRAHTPRVDLTAHRERVLAIVRGRPHVVRASLVDLMTARNVRNVPEKITEALLDFIEHRITSAMSTTCESVGCIAAQSIGEPCTQMTLNTFHTAGVSAKNVTLGIPRFKELLDATKTPKTPCTTLRMRRPYRQAFNVVDYIANTLPLTRLGDVIQMCDIVDDPATSDGSTSIADDAWIVRTEHMLHENGDERNASRFVIRMICARDVMRRRHLTPPVIRRVLSERLGSRAGVCSSEVNAVEWVIRIRLNHICEIVEFGGISEMILNQQVLNMLLDVVVVSGHPNVTDASVGEAPSDDADTEYVVHAFGNVLLDCNVSDCVDWTRCTSNDIWEVYNLLGIEACAHVLFEEMTHVVSFDGTYIDPRHISLIVDSICRGGNILPLNRHGINRTDKSPLMRCSFEETTDVLCEAAMFAQHENASGVTTSIMSGQLARFGTGMTNVYVVDRKPSLNDGTRVSQQLMRSTCRSYVEPVAEECLEYVIDVQRPVTIRPMSPPIQDDTRDETNAVHGRRVRFRMMSPQRNDGGAT